MRKLLLALVLALPVSLVSCGPRATPTTPVAPNSPQTQVINITKTLADAINGAVKTALTLQDQGVISLADTQTVMMWSKFAAGVDDQIATELGSGDTWTVQKQKIVASLVGFKLPPVTSNQALQSALQSVLALIQQIQGQVAQ